MSTVLSLVIGSTGLTSESSAYVKCKSQFIATYNYKDFFLSPQRVAINGAIICRGFEPGLSRSRVRHSTAEPRRLHVIVGGVQSDRLKRLMLRFVETKVSLFHETATRAHWADKQLNCELCSRKLVKSRPVRSVINVALIGPIFNTDIAMTAFSR